MKFGNYCKKPSGGKTPGFWHNKNGEALMNDGGTMAPELGLLSSLKLVKPQAVRLISIRPRHAQFATWLLDGNAVNMAYMLSVHLAAMTLNVEANLVNEDAFYIPFGGTIGAVAGPPPMTPSSPTSTRPPAIQTAPLQEELKNFLDQLNNNALVIPPTPCRQDLPVRSAVLSSTWKKTARKAA